MSAFRIHRFITNRFCDASVEWRLLDNESNPQMQSYHFNFHSATILFNTMKNRADRSESKASRLVFSSPVGQGLTGHRAAQVAGGVDEADVTVRLWEVAEKVAGARVDHLREQA